MKSFPALTRENRSVPKTREEHGSLLLHAIGQIRKTPPITESGNCYLSREKQRPMGNTAEGSDRGRGSCGRFGSSQIEIQQTLGVGRKGKFSDSPLSNEM